MVIENAGRRTNHSLGVALDVPRETNTWSEVIFVARKSLLHIHGVLRRQQISGGKRNAGQWILKRHSRNLLANFVIVTDPIIQRKIPANLPRILCEPGDWLVADAANRISESLDVV